MKFLHKLIQRIKNILHTIENLNRNFDEIKLNQGLILSKLNHKNDDQSIISHEFKIFSQWGEDGIIQHLTNSIPIKNKTFIEFGVEDFNESNCRFLLMKDNWQGFIIDGSLDNINKIRNAYFYWKYALKAFNAFVTAENINEVLQQSGFNEDIGILSIDIDGNDWFILKAITAYKPRILICEYNDTFGKDRKISVPYDANFYRTDKHYSNLYFGASLAAITFLADQKGYSFVGINSNCNNAFFVKNDLINEKVPRISIEDAYQHSNIRESRDKFGQLTYLHGDARIKTLKGMPVINVESGKLETL